MEKPNKNREYILFRPWSFCEEAKTEGDMENVKSLPSTSSSGSSSASNNSVDLPISETAEHCSNLYGDSYMPKRCKIYIDQDDSYRKEDSEICVSPVKQPEEPLESHLIAPVQPAPITNNLNPPVVPVYPSPIYGDFRLQLCHLSCPRTDYFMRRIADTAEKIRIQEIYDKKLKRLRPKKFKCNYCDLTFSNNGQLKGHIRSHTGERPFVCDFEGCGKTFVRNEELTRHKRIHTGYRPHVCVVCRKAFGRKDHLKKHMKTHEVRMSYPMVTDHLNPFSQQYVLPQNHLPFMPPLPYSLPY